MCADQPATRAQVNIGVNGSDWTFDEVEDERDENSHASRIRPARGEVFDRA